MPYNIPSSKGKKINKQVEELLFLFKNCFTALIIILEFPPELNEERNQKEEGTSFRDS